MAGRAIDWDRIIWVFIVPFVLGFLIAYFS